MVVWDWNKSIGTLKIGDDATMTLYEGNAFLIGLYEFTAEDGQEQYQLGLLFADEGHAKRSLGLTKRPDGGKYNLYGEDADVKLTLIRNKCREFKKIITLFAQAFDNIAISVKGE